MKKVLFVFVSLALCLMVAEAKAELNWAQALKSGPALRSYLEERSVTAYLAIDGEHVYPSSSNYAWTNTANATDLRNAVKSITLEASFDPDYPSFWTRVQYYDQDWNVTVYGIEYVTAAQRNGAWVIPNSVTLRVPDYLVALPLPDGNDLWNAYVNIYDSNGQVIGQRNCEVFTAGSGQRYIRYPGWITGDQLAVSGQTAELRLMESDGQGGYSTIVINPSTGEESLAEETQATLSPTIEGREYLAANQNIVVVIPSQDSVGINPLYQLPITQTVLVTVKARTSEGEFSPSFQYRRLKDANYSGDTEWRSSPTGQIQLEPGVYDIWFEWVSFHEEIPHQMWDYPEGGKG